MPRDKHHHMMDYLASLRFPVARERNTVTGVAALLKYYREIRAKREHLPYDIDGTVYKVNDLRSRKSSGLFHALPGLPLLINFRRRKR